MMIFYTNQMFSIALMTATNINFALCWPILDNRYASGVQVLQNSLLPKTRLSRQVVQPTWLNFGEERRIESKVHVNKQTLSEAAEIRKAIQKAVHDGTYAITDQKPIPHNAVIKPTSKETNATHNIQSLTNLFALAKNLWRNWNHSLSKIFRN